MHILHLKSHRWIPGLIAGLGILIFLFFHSPIISHSFGELAMELFRHELSENTLNLHYTLADPDACGLKESSSPTFGTLDHSSLDKELDYLKKYQKKLQALPAHGLNQEEQLTADILDWWLTGQIHSEEYYYYQEPLGPTLGIQAQLPVLLAEFPFRDQADVDTYLKLITTLPDYFQQIAEFEEEKSRLGLFMNDEILDRILNQCQSLFSITGSHFLVTTFQERLDSCDFLSSDQKIAYEAHNHRILQNYFAPAYQSLSESIGRLRGTGKNPNGLYHTPDGISYYESLLKYSIGTDLSMAKIHQLLEEQMESDYETILYAIHQGMDLLAVSQDTPSIEQPADILKDLQGQIQADFPRARAISWQVKKVPASLADHLSPAFYMTPAIDAEEQNTIYINPSYEPDRTELITTLAHEGYPGHLYQNSFEKTIHPVRNLIYIGGYTEGWGLYSEFYAYDFLGLSDTEADFLRALSSLNYAICASLDLSIHGEGWTEEDCIQYLSAFGITDRTQIHELYLNILEEPSNYLKYYLGYLEICRLKESALALSPDLSLYDFHKWFLESGPAPFPILKKRLQLLEVSSQLLQSTDQNIHLLALEPFHNRPDHLLMEAHMSLIGCNSLFRQGKKHDPLILRTADT